MVHVGVASLKTTIFDKGYDWEKQIHDLLSTRGLPAGWWRGERFGELRQRQHKDMQQAGRVAANCQCPQPHKEGGYVQHARVSVP